MCCKVEWLPLSHQKAKKILKPFPSFKVYYILKDSIALKKNSMTIFLVFLLYKGHVGLIVGKTACKCVVGCFCMSVGGDKHC